MSDARSDIYGDLHEGQLKAQEQANRQSAERILDILWDYLQPQSVLDVGCGIGTWLAVLQSRGINDVRGIDGPWLKSADVVCDRALLQVCDLEVKFAVGRVFDLVVCLEVAEHLSSAAAEQFISSLVSHSQAVLFSAAIPFQGGHHHVNEQFLSYWAAHFAKHDFQPIDIFRGRIWNDPQIMWWLRQNLVLFVHKDIVRTNDKLSRAASEHQGPISIVHPDMYLSRLQGLVAQLNQLQKLGEYLRAGGTFRSDVGADGQISLTRLEKP
jgi:SAM-dependent methyltransferase